jgi:transposase-like protein
MPNYFNRTEMKNTGDAAFDSTKDCVNSNPRKKKNLSDAQNQRLVMELLHLATDKKIPKGGKESVAEQFGVSIRTLERIWKRYWDEKLISNSTSPVLAERKKGNCSRRELGYLYLLQTKRRKGCATPTLFLRIGK